MTKFNKLNKVINWTIPFNIISFIIKIMILIIYENKWLFKIFNYADLKMFWSIKLWFFNFCFYKKFFMLI